MYVFNLECETLQVKEAILAEEAYCAPETAVLLSSYSVSVYRSSVTVDTIVCVCVCRSKPNLVAIRKMSTWVVSCPKRGSCHRGEWCRTRREWVDPVCVLLQSVGSAQDDS